MQLPTGEDYHLSHVNSGRLKFGIREAYEINKIHKIYCGLGLEYEFNVKAYATYQGLRTDTPSTKGTSGLFEFGWTIKSKADDKLSFDLSGAWTFGKQRGLVGRFGINWLF